MGISCRPRLLFQTVCLCLMVDSIVCALPDWLVTKVTTPTQLVDIAPDTIRLTNGLISRDFLLKPDFVTIDFYSHEKQSSILRAISPESVINLDGLFYNVGGVNTKISRGYLNRTGLAEDISLNSDAFHYVSHSTSKPEAPFPYRPKRYAPADIVWPPAGLRLDVVFKAPFWAPRYHQEVTVIVHYEMYDGIPLLSKWVSIQGLPAVRDRIEVFVNSIEYLAVNWQWAQGGYGWLHVENDVPHTTTNWFTEPSQGAMPGSFQQAVNCTYPQSGLVPLKDGFESFRVHLLAVGSSDPERFGLALRKKMRLLAPHTQENPIFFHMTNSDSPSLREVMDQLADVGFEMLIFSFGSSFDMESDDPAYLERMTADIAYANSKGIEVGGYDLIVWTRGVPNYWMAAGSDGACIASGWYDYLLTRVLNFMDRTGLSMVETDGPYPGYKCSSTNHSHHQGVDDSQYWQLKLQSEFYKILREKEIYINQPDNYFYQGGSKTAMGYDENQYSLPRWQDITVSRQGMYDDTFHYIPSVGWMFMPLVDYHGGGSEAAFEPLAQHIVEFEWGLAQYFGAGVAACYRGYRIYDSNETRAVVVKWVSFYKKYRDILTSDIVHVKRPDLQSVDSYMHVNPRLPIKGLVMVFNPTMDRVSTSLNLPLYYTGLTDVATISEQGSDPKTFSLDRAYNVEIPVDLKPLNITWFLVE